MAKSKTNGSSGLVPRYLSDSEIAAKANRAATLNRQLREIPKKKKSLTEERDHLLEEIAEKCEMVEGEELPFTKEQPA